MRTVVLRRVRPAMILAATALVLSACGSDTASGPVTVTQNVTVVPTVTVPEVPATTSAVPEPTASEETPPEPTSSDPTADDTSAVSESAPSSSEESAPVGTTEGSVSAPPPDLVVRTAQDPDTPGAVGGAACATDPAYFDEDPAGMAPDALAAWTAVVQTAAAEGVVLCLHDGKRSAAQQQAQYDEYAAEYGTEVADQLVLPWEKSAHVTGYAVDVHPAAAYSWLQARNGVDGWCRIYDNESWHFEFAEEYRGGCPTRLPKPQR